MSQCSIAPLGNPLRPKNRCLQLFGSQHQWRHIVTPVERVPDPCFTTDWNTLACQISHVTVHRPDRDAQLCCNSFCRNRTARAPENLNYSKESVGSAHGQDHADTTLSVELR